MQGRRKRTRWEYFKQNRELFLMSFPGIVYKLIFAYIPMIGLIVAFKDYRFDKGMFGSRWVGFKNFEFLLVSDYAWRITRNTIFYSLGYLLLTTITALTLAVLMNELHKRWIKLHQTILFLPYFLSWVVVGYVTFGFLDGKNGYLNQLLQMLGLSTHSWYLEADAWPYLLNAVHLWKSIGFATLIYFAGVVGIPQEYYEAARMDGATRLQLAVRITIPQLTPLIVIIVILAIGSMFRGDFGLHYFIPNNSGPTYPTTDIIDTYVFRALRELGDIGMSSAVGLYQSVVGFILVISANFVVKKVNSEHSLW